MVQKNILMTCCLFALAISVPSIALLRAAEPIHQTFVGYVSYNAYLQEPWEPIKIGPVTIKISEVEDEIVVSGLDKQDHPWNVHLKTAGGSGYSLAWTTDLDGDRTRDLIFVHQETLNGRCATRNRLTTILFDSQGRPSPSELEGHFLVEYGYITNSGRGVLDIGDWNKNGRAELVQTACYGYTYQDLAPTPYGLVAVYEAHNGVWRRLSGAERAGQEAIYHEFADSGFRKLYPETENIEGFVSDYSNDRAGGRTGKITAFMPTPEGDERRGCGVLREFDEEQGRLVQKSEEEKQRTRERCDYHFVLENGTVCYSQPGIVLNRSVATEAFMDGESQRAQSLLERIIEERLPVTLTGQLEEGVCSPTLIWASAP